MLYLIKSFFIILILFFYSSLPVSGEHQTNKVFKDFIFWRTSEGYWEASNTYFDSDMNYTIRSYSSLILIILNGKKYSETEYRFYPFGIAAERYGKGIVKNGEGIEVIVNYSGQLINDMGSMGFTKADHGGVSSGDRTLYKLLSEKDSLRVNRKKDTRIDSYRLYTTFTSPNHRLRSNFGFYYKDNDNDPGSMRAFILSQDHRIKKEDFEARRLFLRKKYNIKNLSYSDPKNQGESIVERLRVGE